MPKLSRRRRQLKEIQANTKKDYIYDEDDNVDDIQDNQIDEAVKKPKTSKTNTATAQLNYEAKQQEDEKPWVQCNICDKWRALPKNVDIDTLPDLWTCSMNIWDSQQNNCDAPEESYELVDEELKSFCRLWTKKLKSVDRAESRMPSSNFTRGKKKKIENDWIQCQNPACMKWRVVSVKGLDYSNMFHKLNTKGSWRSGSNNTKFYCSMNYWDETKASCSAPQESVIDAPWNLENII